MTWWMYAIGAAMMWGIHYLLLDKAMTVISPITAYWMPTALMMIGLPFLYTTLADDYHAVMGSDWDVKLPVFLITFTGLIGTLFIYKAIQMHNPVHVGLIEITYPVFLAVFAFIIYQENHITLPVLVGGSLILIGSSVIIYFNS